MLSGFLVLFFIVWQLGSLNSKPTSWYILYQQNWVGWKIIFLGLYLLGALACCCTAKGKVPLLYLVSLAPHSILTHPTPVCSTKQALYYYYKNVRSGMYRNKRLTWCWLLFVLNQSLSYKYELVFRYMKYVCSLKPRISGCWQFNNYFWEFETCTSLSIFLEHFWESVLFI